MRKHLYIIVSLISLVLASCASSSSTTTASNGAPISNYKYIVFGNEDEGDAELADIILLVQNELSEKLTVVSSYRAIELVKQGEYVMSPKISVKSEKWEGGHTYISIIFYDYGTNQSIAVVKSSGIGMSISEDQRLAYRAIKKELDKTFK